MRILLIDDDALVLKTIRTVLEMEGHEVIAVQGGQLGVDTFKTLSNSQPVDIVLTDLGMPNVDGRQVASTVKGLSPSTPVLLLTGSGENPDHTRKSDFDLVIGKPIRLHEIRDALKRFSGGKT